MQDLKVTYFDLAGSRGEEVRLALVLAGVPFEDSRLGRDAFAALKPALPFGSLPVFEMTGKGVFAQTNAILRLIGRLHGLYPDDPFEAARHDVLMEAVEECRTKLGATIRIRDEAEKLATRKDLAATYLPHWARGIEAYIGEGPFVGGTQAGVADIKLYVLHSWVSRGVLDGIPAGTFAHFEAFGGVASAVAAHPAVVGWYASAA